MVYGYRTFSGKLAWGLQGPEYSRVTVLHLWLFEKLYITLYLPLNHTVNWNDWGFECELLKLTWCNQPMRRGWLLDCWNCWNYRKSVHSQTCSCYRVEFPAMWESSFISHCPLQLLALWIQTSLSLLTFLFVFNYFPQTAVSSLVSYLKLPFHLTASATRIHDLAWRPAIESGPTGNFVFPDLLFPPLSPLHFNLHIGYTCLFYILLLKSHPLLSFLLFGSLIYNLLTIFFSSPFPSLCLISYLSTSILRDGLENINWHFFHHLSPILSISVWTPRPLCSIVFTPTTIELYPAGSALPLCLHITGLYTCSPSCSSPNIPTQCRARYQSTDSPCPVWSVVHGHIILAHLSF